MIFNAWQSKCKNEAVRNRLTSFPLSGLHLSCVLKLDEDTRYLDNFYLLNKLKFVHILKYILVNFVNTKMVEDLILKISRPGVFDIRCVNWNTAIIVFI